MQEDFISSTETLEQLGSCWEGLEYPGSDYAAFHDFDELLMIALCRVLCVGGCLCRGKERFLRSFLGLANGLPIHDTFSRLWRDLDPDQATLHWPLPCEHQKNRVCHPVVSA